MGEKSRNSAPEPALYVAPLIDHHSLAINHFRSRIASDPARSVRQHPWVGQTARAPFLNSRRRVGRNPLDRWLAPHPGPPEDPPLQPASIKDSGVIPDPVATLRESYRTAVHEATRRVLGEVPTAEGAEDLATIAATYADREVAAWRDRPGLPVVLACRAGCSYCCHYPVTATVPEVIRITATLQAEATEGELAVLREKIEAHEQARTGLVGPERSRIPVPCPLLEQGRCSAYEIRPLTCRGWTSLDVSRCEAFYQDPSADAAIPIDGVQHAIARGIALGIQGGLRSEGLSDHFVELVPALRIALGDPSAIDRWLAGESSFRDAELAPDDPAAPT